MGITEFEAEFVELAEAFLQDIRIAARSQVAGNAAINSLACILGEDTVEYR